MLIFPQFSIFDGENVPVVKHYDMKWIEIALKYCTLTLISSLHNMQFVKYDVTVSFMAQVLDTVTYLVPQVLNTASSSICLLLLQTGHPETVHAPVADTVAYFAGLNAPVVDTVTYFGGNHRSRV